MQTAHNFDVPAGAYGYFDLYGGKEVCFIQTIERTNDLGGISDEDSPTFWIRLEPADTGTVKYAYIGCSIAFITEHLQFHEVLAPKALLTILADVLKNNSFILNYLRYEYLNYSDETQDRSFQKLYCSKWLSNVIYFLIFYVNEVLAEGHNLRFGRLEKKRIMQLETKLSQKLNAAIPEVGDMAKSVNMSLSKFKYVFKEIYGASPYQHFLNLKFRYAISMIQEEGYSFGEVSHRLGFSHPSALTRLFKSKTGEIPREAFNVRN